MIRAKQIVNKKKSINAGLLPFPAFPGKYYPRLLSPRFMIIGFLEEHTVTMVSRTVRYL